MRVLALLVGLVTTAACSAPAGQPGAQTTPVSAPAAATPNDQSVARADALLEDLKRRETAQYEFNRKHPPQESIPSLAPVSDPVTTQPPAAPPPVAASPTAAAPAAASTDTRDEAWWRGQSESLQRVLDAALIQLAEAEKQNLKYGYEDGQAIYRQRVDAVAAARLAIDNLHSDARRAGVPPGWLRN